MKRKIFGILALLAIPLLMAAAGVGPSAWTKFTQAIADGDYVAMTDISDTTQSSSGTSKAATALQMKTYVMGGGLPTAANQVLQATGVGTYAWTSTLEGIIDDTKGNGDTTYIWSADKVYDELATKQAADADLNTWAGITPGTGVGTMLAIAPGSAGGPTTTVWSGTVELNTTTVAASGVIASGACQLLATHITAANVVAASDGVDFYFIGTPTAKTGFAPSANGMLTLIPYSDADGYVQVATCNNTAASITLNTAGNGATIKLVVRR